MDEASLVVQWLRVCLAMGQGGGLGGTPVGSLGQEDPTSPGAAKPERHNHWACALGPGSRKYWAHEPRASTSQQERPPQGEAHTPQLERSPAHRSSRKPMHSKEDPAQPNKKCNKQIFLK